MKKFFKVLLVCLVFGVPTHLIVKSLVKPVEAQYPLACFVQVTPENSGYDQAQDQVWAEWVASCSNGNSTGCDWCVNVTIWQYVGGGYAPIGKACWDYHTDCGGSNTATTYLTDFFAGAQPGTYKITFVAKDTTCDLSPYTGGVLASQTEYVYKD